MLVGACSPLLISRQMNKANRANKQADWDREDEVAARAEAAAADMAKSQAAIIAASTVTVQKLTDVQAATTVIHGLVNSSYTAALELARVALVGQLLAREDNVEFKRSLGHDPTEADTETLGRLRTQIAALETTIADRLAAQHLAEAQVAEGGSEAPAPSFAVDVPVEVPVFPPPPAG